VPGKNQEGLTPKAEGHRLYAAVPRQTQPRHQRHDPGGLSDVPEAHTFGEDEGEALMLAVDAFEAALCMYIDNRRDIPQALTDKAARQICNCAGVD